MMTTQKQQLVSSYPSAVIPNQAGGLPVEVVLIGQLGVGGGSMFIHDVAARQRHHHAFVDALDEPSARIGAMNLNHSDPSSLYTFMVEENGHPFHRHAGQRTFTAIAGSSGCLLRFSTASDEAMAENPQAFMDALHQVTVPPDALFTVRFGGGTWHQFLPQDADQGHAALFAISCHTNELHGLDSDGAYEQVKNNQADIPSLTEVLPEAVQQVLASVDTRQLPTTALSLVVQSDTVFGQACKHIRQRMGKVRSHLSSWRPHSGFVS